MARLELVHVITKPCGGTGWLYATLPGSYNKEKQQYTQLVPGVCHAARFGCICHTCSTSNKPSESNVALAVLMSFQKHLSCGFDFRGCKNWQTGDSEQVAGRK